MKNIIKLDLRKFNHIKLIEIGDKYEFDNESLLKNKKSGFAIIWYDIESKILVAFTRKKDNNIYYTNFMDEFLDSITEIEMLSRKNRVLEDLTVDNILEKISKYGIDSLTKAEKDFLDNSVK
jgi:hypothetical protein